jgi:hypothetical protein
MNEQKSVLEIVRVVPGKAADDTLTPGRKFLQVIFRELPPEGFITQKREGSRNFWEGFFGKTEDGRDLNIKADPIYMQLCEHVDVKADTPWTEDTFRACKGLKVFGDIVTEYVKPYKIPNGLSENNTRFQYTAVVLDGDSKESVFRNQGHTVISDPRELELIKIEAERVSKQNQEARDARQAARGIPPAGDRVGTGTVNETQQYKA